ncbi:MAG: hypothetical protein K2I81_02355 [Alphaproteobacteria bacterium]|nr:hypothetical protein [Alphaproteobacteria bacterium]
MFTADWFNSLDKTLRDLGMDSDAQSFDEIRENLSRRHICTADEFAQHCAYVILAGGFSQKTAKKIHAKIMDAIASHGADFDLLMGLFANKNKINAICKIWLNRTDFCRQYYELNNTDARVSYLSKLPHIGKITANHLARNLGEDVVKYDIWIQRLGVLFSGNKALAEKINNGKLDADIRHACDEMFSALANETGLPRGYIDVVLWKSCQQGLIKELS